MLEVRNLSVEVGGHAILENINLKIKKGEVLALLGPNGSGKTSLLMAIMGFSNYKITNGEIIFKEKVINKMTIDERARLGIGVMLQKPPAIRGVKTRQIAQMVSKGKFDIEAAAKELDLTDFLNRDVNLNFSGGEIKRSEVFQIMAQAPDLSLFDEPESGVDLENLQLVGKAINKILSRDKDAGSKKSGLIITHTGFILDYVDVDNGCVLLDKRMHCIGEPKKLLKDIRKYGYQRCVECRKTKP